MKFAVWKNHLGGQLLYRKKCQLDSYVTKVWGSFLHQKFCFFYTKNFALFTPFFCFFLHQFFSIKSFWCKKQRSKISLPFFFSNLRWSVLGGVSIRRLFYCLELSCKMAYPGYGKKFKKFNKCCTQFYIFNHFGI